MSQYNPNAVTVNGVTVPANITLERHKDHASLYNAEIKFVLREISELRRFLRSAQLHPEKYRLVINFKLQENEGRMIGNTKRS